nr:immunoglobulin light chain junction region [Macaca mulatta]
DYYCSSYAVSDTLIF